MLVIQTASYQASERDLTLQVSWLHPMPYQPRIFGDHQAATSVSLPLACPLSGSVPHHFSSHSSSIGSTFKTHLHLKETLLHGCHFENNCPRTLGKLFCFPYWVSLKNKKIKKKSGFILYWVECFIGPIGFHFNMASRILLFWFNCFGYYVR